MYGILQRKYELMRGPGAGRGLPEKVQARPTEMGGGYVPGERKGTLPSASSPRRDNSNDRSSQDARQRQAMKSLADFFGV